MTTESVNEEHTARATARNARDERARQEALSLLAVVKTLTRADPGTADWRAAAQMADELVASVEGHEHAEGA